MAPKHPSKSWTGPQPTLKDQWDALDRLYARRQSMSVFAAAICLVAAIIMWFRNA